MRLHSPVAYPHLFWEGRAIGQALYLEAEALMRANRSIRSTGIGCFYDDAVHDLLGISLAVIAEAPRDDVSQSLYHFTIGGPRDDQRLRTTDPYVHDLAPG